MGVTAPANQQILLSKKDWNQQKAYAGHILTVATQKVLWMMWLKLLRDLDPDKK